MYFFLNFIYTLKVEYLFTDKTGTLTENDMVFRRCSINSICYEELNGHLRRYDEKSSDPTKTMFNLPVRTKKLIIRNKKSNFYHSLKLKTISLHWPPATRCKLPRTRLKGPHTWNTRLQALTRKPWLKLLKGTIEFLNRKCSSLLFLRCGAQYTGEIMEEMIIKMSDGRSIKYKRLETIEFTSGIPKFLDLDLKLQLLFL
jgi:magnesium-transporting ATPase (P-type)